ncbi:MAG TPA: TRAP transporter small permease, partial [Alphaproteobacteria bacterium]|nr:TRAP transporter small permease [Alphaproteobacteria bacterium]
MDAFIRLVGGLSRILGVASAVLLSISVVVILHLVFVRYVLAASAIWQHEFVTYSLVAATFLGAPYVLLLRGHVNVDLLPQMLGRRGRFALAVVASLIGIGFCAALAWYSFDWWYEAYAKGWRSQSVWAPPLWIPYLTMPLGMTLITLQYLADILALVTGREPP